MTTEHDSLSIDLGRDATSVAEATPTRPSTEPDPFDTVQSLALGYGVSRCLHVVAALGLADHLADDEARTVTDLAAAVDADPDALSRVLRLLSASGVFDLQGEMVRHTPVSRLLRSDHPRSMRAFVRMLGAPPMWKAFEPFEASVRTGVPATEEVLPGGLMAYYAQHPREAQIFNAAMAAKAQGHIAGILASYDFSGIGVIGDIGGGRGHLLKAVLDTIPSARGVLFELPHVTAEVAGLASDRLTLQPGDFFRDALPTCDAYVLMEVIHAWGDEEAVAILRAVRLAAPAHAKLLLIEQMVPDDPGPAWTKMLDILMLALLGGRQRTAQEYATLLQQSGFALEREIETSGGISILEAVTA